jgi:hypothetical protein
MTPVEARRASRHHVKWPARVRRVTESDWNTGQVINLSVTGVLMKMERRYEVGERVEVEIDFLAQPESKTVVTGLGYVVREHDGNAHLAAIHFDLGFGPAPRLIEPVAPDAQP